MKVSKKVLSIILAITMMITALPLVGVDLFTSAEAKTISEYSVGDIIEFGSYPQTQVTDTSLISQLNSIEASWLSFGYIDSNGEEYMFYKDVILNNNKYRGVTFTKNRGYSYSNGYSVENIYWFKYEALTWKVLNPTTGLVVCEKVIDSQPYHHTSAQINGYYGNNYEMSDIRKWLTNNFYDIAFSDIEKLCIKLTSVDNTATSSSYSAKTTNDYIFALSRSEASNYKSICGYSPTTTSYAKIQGAWCSSSSSSYLWGLRTAGSYSYGITYVKYGRLDRNTADDAIQCLSMGVRPALYLNLNSDLENINNEYPDGYNYDEDSYSFSNIDDTVSIDIYKDVFGDEKGQIVYDVMEAGKDSHGLCYGMAATTACLLNDIPYVDSFIKLTGPCETISDINRGTKSIELDMITAKTFVKYGYVTQFSTLAERTWDCESLYNAVWDYVHNGGAPVIISIREYEYNDDENEYEQTVGHAVLAIGIEGNDTIIVDDSNSPDEERKITLTRNSDGEFTGEWSCDFYSWSYGNNSFEGTPSRAGWIGYTTSVVLPSMVKMYHAELDTNITYAEEDESSDAICDFAEIDTEYNLLYISNETSVSCNRENLIEIDDPITGDSTSSDSSGLYWVDNDKNVSLENTSDEDIQVKFTDNYSGIATTLTTGSAINALVDDSTDNYVDIDCADGEEIDVAFSLTDCTGEKVEIVVSATANDESVTASLTDNGITISGVSDGDVSVIKYDEIVETKTIVEDENEIEIETELPHTGHIFVDGVCTECGERTVQLEEMSPQIRFNRNDDNSYAGTFDVRTRAMISDEDFTELVGATNAEAIGNIDKIGFVYTLDGENFDSASAQAVAQGESITGYVNAPVKYIQDKDGYYMFTCLVTGIPDTDKEYTLTAYAYICVNGKWYFSEAPMNADFNSLYETYYPQACEKYGW